MKVIIPDDRGRTFNPFRASVVVRVRWIMRRRNNGCCCQNSKRAGRSGCNDSEGNEPPGWCIYATVALVAVGCYLNALGGDFVHDDIPAVVRNKDVLAQNPWTSILKDDFWGTPMHDINSHKSYRPLTTLTFRWVQSAFEYLFVILAVTKVYQPTFTWFRFFTWFRHAKCCHGVIISDRFSRKW